MCGIGGGVFRPGDSGCPSFLARCTEDHRNRGPDNEQTHTETIGEWLVGVSHTRLAIIDLTPAGNQPMALGSTLLISYNGEVFNFVELRAELERLGHRFESQSDTEVILAAYHRWGRDAFARLNGFFAFALLDRRTRTLLLVRDRFGVKPLYYHLCGDKLLFSSTARPIAAVVGREPDLEYLQRGLATQLYEDGSERTQYRRVAAVVPGHCYAVDLSRAVLELSRVGFYDLGARIALIQGEIAARGVSDLVEECRRRVASAVELRLRSDVPVGVSLSGGVDSATIAALASGMHRGIVGFTFGRPDRRETEGPAVADLARQLRIEPVYVWPTPAEMSEQFWTCLQSQDSPFTSGSVVAQHAVYRAAREAGIKVVLGGQGGDETFLGYRKSFIWNLREAWNARSPRDLVVRSAALLQVAAAELPRLGSYQGAVGLRLGLRRRRVALHGLARSTGLPVGATVRSRQIHDVLRGGLQTLLRYEDRNSMAWSIESRLPFMDYRLLEWAIALPTGVKLKSGFAKWILRRAMDELLPRGISWQRAKRGFDVGVDAWMASGLGRAIRADIARSAEAVHRATGWRPEPRRFHDRALARDRLHFVEATTAIWLGGVV